MTKRFTVLQCASAIKNSGGIMSAIAHSLGCDWHTADKFISGHPTLLQAVHDEKHQITDKAKRNVIKAIDEGDLQMSKWWLSVMDAEFIDKSTTDINNKGDVNLRVIYDTKPDA